MYNCLVYRHLAVLVLSAFVTILTAQNPIQNIQFKNITRAQGLPNNNINHIITDNYGFVWVATNDGLCKYYTDDRVKIYKADEDNPSDGLQSSLIYCLYADDKDYLWIGTRYGGLSRLHLPTETWKTFMQDSTDNTTISNNEIMCISEDKEGNLLVGTENGLNIYQEETESFIRFQNDQQDSLSISAQSVLDILVDDKGWVWASTWAGGINLMIEDPSGDKTKNTFVRFSPDNTSNSQNVWSIYQDSEKRYWAGTNMGGLFVMDLPPNANNNSQQLDWEPKFFIYKEDQNDPNSLESSTVLDIHEDKSGALWFASSHGLHKVQKEDIPARDAFKGDTIPTIKFYSCLSNRTKQTSILDDYLNNIMEDDQGIIWVGTAGGISQFSWYTNQFDLHNLIDPDQLFPNSRNLYVDSNNTVWIAGGELGLLQYDQKQREYKKYNGLKKSYETVSALYPSRDGNLYLGTNGGIAILDQQSGSIEYLDAPDWLKKEIDNYLFMHVFVDSKDRLWAARETGLFLIDKNSGEYTYHEHDPIDPTTLSDYTVTNITEDKFGNLWISSYNGLNKLSHDEDDIRFKRFNMSNEEGGLSNDRIISLVEHNNILYLGTINGLIKLDIATERFDDVTTLGKYNILAMQISDNNVMWGSTTEGIFTYDIENDKFHLNEKEDGLSNISFRQNSKAIDQNGNFYFGNSSGYIRLDPNKITDNITIPEVYITDVKSSNPSGETYTPGLDNSQITLPYDNYSVAFNFFAMNYNRAEKNKFAYKLEGFDENWTYLDKNIPAVYTNLDAGEYTFRVKGSNNNGYWNEEGASYTVIVKPAFWETWWFKFLASLFAGLLIYYGLHRYTIGVQKRNKELKEYNLKLNKEIQERNKFEAALQKANDELQRSNSELEQFAYIASHDLQEPLGITGSFIDLLADKYANVLDDNAFKYIDFAKGGVNRMGLLIKNLLTFSKVGGTVLDFHKTSLKEVVEEKLLDLGRMVKSKNVTIEIGELPEIYCEKNQMAMLFYNLINNAIKFNQNPNPVVTISTQNSLDKDYYLFYVADNGIGIDSKHQDKIFEIFKRLHDKDAYEGTGIGLALCKKIVTRHGGKIWIESKLGKGTTFYFTIAKDLHKAKELVQKEPAEYAN